MKKKFSLLELFPSSNREWASYECHTKAEAITYFKSIYPELNLDSTGYAKEGDKSFCVAENFQPISY